MNREIYIRLLNEGTPVCRPTKGMFIRENIYRVLPTHDYDTRLEEWEFLPETIVECRNQPITEGGDVVYMAYRIAMNDAKNHG